MGAPALLAGGEHALHHGRSEPTEHSPVYNGPFRVSAATTVRAKMIWHQERPDEETRAVFDLNDTVPPHVTGVSTLPGLPQVQRPLFGTGDSRERARHGSLPGSIRR